MKVLLLRHGATAGNERRKYIGRTDEPLSGQGIAQARALAERGIRVETTFSAERGTLAEAICPAEHRTRAEAAFLGERGTRAGAACPVPACVYVTPLIRTRQTAAILFPGAEQIVVDDLREMDFGDFENRSAEEMAEDAAYREWVEGECEGPCPGGESKADFLRRVQEAFARVIAARMEAASSREPAVFVVHGGTIMAVLEKYARPAMEFYEGHVQNCQGIVCTVLPGTDGLPFVLGDIVKTQPPDRVPEA